MQQTTFDYASHADRLSPLLADAVFIPDGLPKPMVAVLHGFQSRRQDVLPDCRALAARGLFCVTPDMRGHGDSAGEHDCGALQICDIVDALGAAAARWPQEADTANVNAVGYSGGGGNVLSLATKFPDLLDAGSSFFGVSDYAMWYRDRIRPGRNDALAQILGGTPDQVPERYAARSSLAAVTNNPHTALRLFWDADETACPPVLNESFLAAAAAAGQTNVSRQWSRPGDAARWQHGYRPDHPQLAAADAIFAPDFLRMRPPRPLPAEGELTVCGYVVTRRFAVWLGDGSSGACRIRYRCANGTVAVTPLETPLACELRVEQDPVLLSWRPPDGLRHG
jgi:pimeloyl-ACP methyl ester carboxylesterase